MERNEGLSSSVPVDPRVQFAAERTLLAWIRTGLAMMGFGFVVARSGLFMRELLATHGTTSRRLGLSLWVGTALVLLGVCVNVAAAAQHWGRIRRLSSGEPLQPSPLPLASIVAAVLAALGVVTAGYLIRAG